MVMPVPPDVLRALPAYCASEAEWQAALELVLCRVLPVRLFRQVPGKRKVEGGGWMRGAPVGASDLTGWVTGPGTRIELECKFDDGRTSKAQRVWAREAAQAGCVVLSLRGRSELPTAVQVLLAVDELAAVLRGRGVDCG